jgi:hypothetical protein|tara:strand:+ start:90 stop:236 length:147 start_codon:yes stop_codon:yes gene_type:complete
MEFSYLYDFGDEWMHHVSVEDQGAAQKTLGKTTLAAAEASLGFQIPIK